MSDNQNTFENEGTVSEDNVVDSQVESTDKASAVENSGVTAAPKKTKAQKRAEKTENAMVAQNKQSKQMVSTQTKGKNVPAKAQAKQKTAKLGFFKRIGRFFKEIVSELKKVTWPKWKTVTTQTGIVLVVVLFFFLALLGIDSLLLYLYNLLVGA